MKPLLSTHTSRTMRTYFPAALALAGSILLSACGVAIRRRPALPPWISPMRRQMMSPRCT